MSEYIKREDAIDAVNTYEGQRFGEDRDMYIKRALSELSAADVARVRHGHWINDIGYAGWTCSECGNHEGNKTDKYCHNCGAKMDGEEQEHE